MKANALSALALLLLLSACGGKQQESAPATEAPREPCPFAYTYAPGNYLIEIASGAQVVLDPVAQDFPLFCAPGEARAAVTAEIQAGRLPEGDWRIYRLDGNFDDLAQPSGPGQYQLKRLAQLVDWAVEGL